MSPYERGDGRKSLKPMDVVGISNPRLRSKGFVLIVSDDSTIADPGPCGELYLGDISEDGKHLEGAERIIRPQPVYKKSISYSPGAKPAVIWRPANNVDNKKP